MPDFKMQAQFPSLNLRNVPCSNFSALLKAIAESQVWKFDSPCHRKRSSYSSISSSAAGTSKMEQPIEPHVLIVGITAQLIRRRNSSIIRRRSERKTVQITSSQVIPHSPTEEWSETFVAQDGVLTTDFCSTEL